MGCHTWFKKESKYSVEDLRKFWVERQEKSIERWIYMKDNPNCSNRTEGPFDNLTQEYFDWCCKVYERQLRMVKNGTIKLDFIYHLYDSVEGEDLFLEHKGKIYSEKDDLPHDIFRIGGYPEDILLNMNETLNFCESKNIELDKKQLHDLNDFWKNNPDGLIRFG